MAPMLNELPVYFFGCIKGSDEFMIFEDILKDLSSKIPKEGNFYFDTVKHKIYKHLNPACVGPRT